MHSTIASEQSAAIAVLLSKNPELGGQAVPFRYLFVVALQFVHTLNDEHVSQV
jgi:hypothetical protein